jgi:hypothetical protein
MYVYIHTHYLLAISMPFSIFPCMYVCMHVFTHTLPPCNIHAVFHFSMYVCMYVCMYIHTHYLLAISMPFSIFPFPLVNVSANGNKNVLKKAAFKRKQKTFINVSANGRKKV